MYILQYIHVLMYLIQLIISTATSRTFLNETACMHAHMYICMSMYECIYLYLFTHIYLFILLPVCASEEYNGYYNSMFDTTTSIYARQFYPQLLLHDQCKHQHSKKGKRRILVLL